MPNYIQDLEKDLDNMSDKKLRVMSISVEPEMQELLKNSAKKAGKNVSSLIRDLVENHLALIVNEGEEVPIILKVPAYLKDDEKGLKDWLALKTDAIVKRLCTTE